MRASGEKRWPSYDDAEDGAMIIGRACKLGLEGIVPD
jgi:hypothetical protein